MNTTDAIPCRSMISRKWFLYLTEFFSGMSVMAVELGASRLLAPYFSSSQIVWTIIIGAIMIAMALGNIWGGRIADKNPDPSRLYFRILIAGVWIAAIPFLGKYVIALVALVTALITVKNYLIWASLISCVLIFVFPLMLLGTVTPSLIKASVKSLNSSGRIAGELGALNTVGSIIGTFLPTFVTIPAVGTSVTFLIFAAILIAISLIYLISERKKIVQSAVLTLFALLIGAAGVNSSFAFWKNDLLYEGESIYNYLQVYENPYEINLSTNVLFGVQSVKRKSPGLTGYYYDTAMAGVFMSGIMEKDDFDILILGLGSGTYATLCREYFGDLDVDIEGVEIDGKIVRLARDYFALPEDVDVFVDDGRSYIYAGEGKNKKYDLILVDAYQDITIPFQMATKEFFTTVYERLEPDGTVVINLNMASDAVGSINQYIGDTLSSVFGRVYSADCGGNRELFASPSKDFIENFQKNYKLCPSPDLVASMRVVDSRLTEYESGNLILTDDKAPVELLGMKVIDSLISEEISSVREQLDGVNLKDMFDMIK